MITLVEPIIIGLYEKYKIFYYGNNNSKKKIYLLGQGWLAKGFMETINKDKYFIVNISRNTFINTPLLLQTVKHNPIKINNASFIKKIDIIKNEEIKNINLETKFIKTNKGIYNWSNGYLVCGLGSNTDQGIYWNEKLANLKKNTFKNKSQNICIIGAGPTGTELSFYLSELGHNVTLIDGLSHSNLYSYLSKLSKNKILKLIKENNINLVTDKLYDKSMKFDDVIFATGSRPNDLTITWDVTPQLNLKLYPNVFVGGDCINQQLLPRNAQVAYQQGVYIAKKLNNEIQDNQKFTFINNGIALYCGNNNYLVEINNSTYIIPSFIVNLYYLLVK